MVLGIQTGTLVWGALTSLGVTALVTASHVVYEILRWAGAAYLLWMATRMIHDTFRVRPTDAATTSAGFPCLASSRMSLLGSGTGREPLVPISETIASLSVSAGAGNSIACSDQ